MPVTDTENAHRMIEIHGRAEMTDEGADDHINTMTKRYLAKTPTRFANQVKSASPSEFTMGVDVERRSSRGISACRCSGGIDQGCAGSAQTVVSVEASRHEPSRCGRGGVTAQAAVPFHLFDLDDGTALVTVEGLSPMVRRTRMGDAETVQHRQQEKRILARTSADDLCGEAPAPTWPAKKQSSCSTALAPPACGRPSTAYSSDAAT